MNSGFVHLIITRFNVRFKGGGFATRNMPGWLEHRFALFEQYCLPTLKSQSSTNFEWILYFDKDTPPSFLDRARTLIADCPHFHLRFVDLYSGDWLLEDLRTYLGDRCNWLLSTRLDNDDGLNEHFVENLQRQVRFTTREALNFPEGIVLGHGHIYRSRQTSNAFLSVSEPFESFQTALHANHKEMAQHMPLREVESGPMWLQVVHDANVSNKRRGWRLPHKRMPSGFEAVPNLIDRKEKDSAVVILAQNLVLSTFWQVRDMLAHWLRNVKRAYKKL